MLHSKIFKCITAFSLMLAMLSSMTFPRPHAAGGKTKVFLLAGQSNMTGIGSVAELPEHLRGEVPRAKYFAINRLKEPSARDHTNGWVIYRPGIDGRTAIGPETKFIYDVSKALNGEIFAVIKIASPGTSLIEDWKSPSAGAPVGPLYTQLIQNTKKALASLGSPYEIAGMGWMQGESDALSPEVANAYGKNLSLFIHDVRRDLAVPNMPFVVAQIDATPKWPQHAIVRKAQASIPLSVANTATIETSDLETDGAHYKTKGLLDLGSRFAAAMLKYLPASLHHSAPPAPNPQDVKESQPTPSSNQPLGGRKLSAPTTSPVSEFAPTLSGKVGESFSPPTVQAGSERNDDGAVRSSTSLTSNALAMHAADPIKKGPFSQWIFNFFESFWNFLKNLF